MDSSGKEVIVLDTGANSVKCGLAGCTAPMVVPNVLGKCVVTSKGPPLRKLVIGEEAVQAMTDLKLEYPFEGGAIKKWNYMHVIWKHALETLLGREDFRECKVLTTEPPFGLPNKEATVQELFEKYQFAALQFSNQAVLATHAHGFKTGIVVEAGESNTSVCPVYENIALSPFARKMPVGGRHITDLLIKLLAIRGYAYNQNVDRERVRLIKEKLCYVAYDVKKEMALARETVCLLDTYTFPDRRQVKIAEERFSAAEALFQPHLVDQDGVGLAELIFETIQSTDLNIRSDLRQHIVLSGGASMLPGIGSRIERELKQLIVERIYKGKAHRLEELTMNIEDDHPLRRYSVFLGASKLANQKKDRESFWTSLERYQEEGYHRVAERLTVHAV